MALANLMTNQASGIIRTINRNEVTGRLPERVCVTFRGSNGAVGKRDSATHMIHWYPAKMFYRIPRSIIVSLDLPDDSVILDPFCGSGTVLLEGAMCERQTIGLDVNPLARLISKVKTTRIDPTHLKLHLPQIVSRADSDSSVPAGHKVLDFWFKPDASASLHRLGRAVDGVAHAACRRFFVTTLSGIIRRVSLADPSIPPPVKLNRKRAEIANDRYHRALAHAESVDAESVFLEFQRNAERNIRRMAELWEMENLGVARVFSGNRHAAHTGLPLDSVDLILTSPPYCGSQKYVRSLRLEMLWLGFSESIISETDRRTLGTERVKKRRTIEPPKSADEDANRMASLIHALNPTRAVMFIAYVRYLYSFAAECKRLLRPGGQAFVSFGQSHIAGYPIDLDRCFCSAAIHAGLEVVTTLVDRIPSRGLITKRHATAGRIDDERVVWLRSP